MDGTIPRAALPLVLARMREMSETYGLQVANVFHAGDGNLHPLILYDANVPDELDKAEAFGSDILQAVRRSRRRSHRRAWCRHREARPDAGDVFRNRPQPAAAAEMRLRPAGFAESRKGLSAIASLRRARAHACAGGQGGVSGYSEILTRHDRAGPHQHSGFATQYQAKLRIPSAAPLAFAIKCAEHRPSGV